MSLMSFLRCISYILFHARVVFWDILYNLCIPTIRLLFLQSPIIVYHLRSLILSKFLFTSLKFCLSVVSLKYCVYFVFSYFDSNKFFFLKKPLWLTLSYCWCLFCFVHPFWYCFPSKRVSALLLCYR